MKTNTIRQRTYSFSLNVIKLLEGIELKRVYYSLSDQVIRSACSIGANIIEAHSSGSRREFLRYFQIALRSANETKYWLGLLRDALEIKGDNISPLVDEANQLANILAASIMTMKGKKRLK